MSKHQHRNNASVDREDFEQDPPTPLREALVLIPEPVPSTPLSVAPTPVPTTLPAMNTSPVKPSLPGIAMHPVQSELVTFAQALTLNKPVEGRWQFGLLELLRNTVAMADVDLSTRQWNAILAFFHKSKGTLMSESHILRPADSWPGSDTEFSLYRRMVYLVCETADPITRRKNVASINLSRVTESLSEDGRNRVVGYYA